MKMPTEPANGQEWTLRKLLGCAGVGVADGSSLPDVKVVALADDSRRVGVGDCFVAVRGVAGDGHKFVRDAASAGASVVVVEEDVTVPTSAVVVRVDDTRVALANLAAAYYGLRGYDGQCMSLIGVTGTNGKTTVSWILRSILEADSRRPAVIGTVGYDLVTRRQRAELTTPGPVELCRCLAEARLGGADSAVIEVSSHALDQHRCDGLSFAAGVFTGLSGDHLDYHGTMERYFGAKRRLFEGLDGDAVAVINADDPASRRMADATRARVVRYGIDSPGAEVTARIEKTESTGSKFVLCGSSFEASISTSLVGRYNVSNALAAAGTAEMLGVGEAAIRRGLENVSGVAGRLERVVSPVSEEGTDRCAAVFVDYAHTDDALANVLGTLRSLTRGRLVCVFGCGGDRDRSKRPRMAAAVAGVADVAWVTSDNPRSEDPQTINDEILPGFGRDCGCEVHVRIDRKSAIESAIVGARAGDVVLIAGKGHEDYQLIGDKVLHFDDREVARVCLAGLAGVAEDAA